MVKTFDIEGYQFPSSVFVSSEHLYFLPLEDNRVNSHITFQCGLDDYIQHSIGLIRFIHFFEETKSNFLEGETLFSVETEKWIGHFIAPFPLTVLTRNKSLIDKPSLMNEDCYDKGWILRIRINSTEKDRLMKLYHHNSLIEWIHNEAEVEKY